MPKVNLFSEENTQRLFGHEAAEDEDPERLREYYFKSSVYSSMTAELPLRILVGHKGIGKSALFKVSMAEDTEAGKLSVLIQPNDIISLATDTRDFLQTIRSWTEGLSEIIVQKALSSFGVFRSAFSIDNLKNYIYKERGIIDFICASLSGLENSNYDHSKELKILQFLDNPTMTVYIDDLDRGWQGKSQDVSRISALLNAVRDMSNDNRELNFKVALRSDVYYLVRTSDESTDKIEGSVIWHAWTNHEIFVLLIKRIETFFERPVDDQKLLKTHQQELARYLDPIIEPRFQGSGHWQNAPMYRVLMSLIRKRPRDLVKLCTLAARQAYIRQADSIGTEDFKKVFEEYSQGRIQDTINEFRSELPTIERLLMNMKPNKRERETKLGYVYTTADLLKKINNISQMNQFRFASGKPADERDLAAFLYKINFLTARKESTNGIVRKYFEENRYLSSSFADFGFDWEVHPAYRWALQPDTIESIFEELQLSEDE